VRIDICLRSETELSGGAKAAAHDRRIARLTN
jgi:hypothetical protein